ncbi:MAG: circularly permuted type 2 ATP-grasp protein, partial [Spongiibacter sp.]
MKRSKDSSIGIDWSAYPADQFFDEMITPKGNARRASREVVRHFSGLSREELEQRRIAAERTVRDMGVSFTVYSDGENIDRVWPFDLIPRVIDAEEWQRTAEGLKQRVRALNMFINDVYHEQQIFADGVVPSYLIKDSKNFRPECVGITPPEGVWAHICGCDLVRDSDGKFYVLEDNLRVPSGVAYMLENREVSKRVLPEFFESNSILPV